jgi:hypothetical protein
VPVGCVGMVWNADAWVSSILGLLRPPVRRPKIAIRSPGKKGGGLGRHGGPELGLLRPPLRRRKIAAGARKPVA